MRLGGLLLFDVDSFRMAHVSFSRGPESVVLTENRLTKVKTRLTLYLKLQLDSEGFGIALQWDWLCQKNGDVAPTYFL